MTALDQRTQAQLADLLDRIADLEAQVRSIPSRTSSTESQNLVLEIAQTGHGFTAGDVVRHNGTTWVLASANDVAADEKLGIVGLVLGANAFLVVLAGSLCLQGLTPWTIYYLGTSGDLVTAPPAHPAIRRAVLLHTTGDVCQLVAPHLSTAHAHRLGDLRDVNLTGLVDGQTIVYENASGTFKPGAAVPSIAGRSVLGNAGNTTAVPTAVTATAADQILMATATGLAWDQITFASLKTSGPGLLGRSAAGAGTAELVTVGASLSLTGGTLSLPDVVAAGSVGSSTQVPVLTYDAKGRITAVSTAAITTAPDTVLGVASNGYIRRTGANTYTADATIPWGSLSGVPGSFTPSAHTHAAGDITSGILATARGGFGTTVASAVGAVTGASNADLFVWWDKTAAQWTTFKLWNPSAVTGWVNCYDTAASDGNAKTTGVMAGTALSVFGRSANTDGLPAAMAAASDHQVMRRNGTTIGFGAVNLAQGNAVTGALGVANGGIGATTATGAGRMPVSSAATTAAWSATPTLGVAGSVLGSLTFESANATAGSRLRVVVAGNEISLYYGGTAATDLVMRIQESDFAAIAASIKGTTNCIQARVIAECDSTGAAKSRVYLCSAQY